MKASGRDVDAGREIFGRVALRKKVERSIRGGHPWIYRDALEPGRAIPDGAVVLVTGRDGKPIGRGFWSSSSPIAVRMLVTEAALDLDATIRARLGAALERRLGALDLTVTNAFRWVHGEADHLPGIHLDVYGTCASLRFDGDDAATFYRTLPDEILALGAERFALTCVLARRRGPRAGSGPRAAGAALPSSAGDEQQILAGVAPPEALVVRENGLAFEVDVRHGQKGGLFLDQRDNRQHLRQVAGGRSVLNLFGYTGGFSVYAAAGGARATTTVDVAPGAVAAARRNFARNDLSVADERARFVTSDVFSFLASAKARGQTWDLVISDPPSFAPSERASPEALRAYRRLHRLCASVLAPDGMLWAASCSSHVSAGAFVASVQTGCSDAGRRFELRELRGAASDHPVIPQFPEGDYLKLAIGLVP